MKTSVKTAFVSFQANPDEIVITVRGGTSCITSIWLEPPMSSDDQLVNRFTKTLDQNLTRLHHTFVSNSGP